MPDRAQARTTETWFFLAVLAIAAVFAWFIFQPYAGALVLAGTLAFIFRPVYRGVLRFIRSESISAFIVLLIVILIIFVPLVLFGVRIIAEASGLYNSLANGGAAAGSGATGGGASGIGANLSASLTGFLHALLPSVAIPSIALNFNDIARQALAWFLQNLGSLFSGITQLFFTLLISSIGLFYFLKDGDRFKEWLLAHIPLAREYAEQIVVELETVVRAVVEGMLAVAVIQGLIVGAGFWIFGVPNPAFWGALTVIVTLVPIVGTWLVAIPGVIYLALTGQAPLAIGLLIWCGILVNLAYNLITPQFASRKADIHPYVILLSVLGGIGFFGPIGFLMGPFVVALLFSLLRIYPRVNGE